MNLSDLDSPAPQSHLRRPWSPDPYDPLPSTSRLNYDPYDDQIYPHYPPQQRREASDVSIEALDLADYTRTLRRNPNSYPTFNSQQDHLSPGSILQSITPPSLVSDGQTASSSRSPNPHSQRSHRAFSLPPPAPAYRPTSPLSRSHNHLSILQHSDNHSFQPDSEIDISRFPQWSRNWYNNEPNHTSADGLLSASSEHHEPKHASPFDPGYRHNPYNVPYPYAPPSTESHRNTLPWSMDPPDYGPPLDAEVKGERMRMLEWEFGSKAKGKGKASDYVDKDGKPMVGTVNEKGKLVTQGPKKRATLRFFQLILALGAGLPSIYVAVTVKAKPAPPPSGTLAAYALYVTSILTFLLLVYLFLFRPCCTGKRPKDDSNGLPNGMMVLPVGVPATGKKGKKPKKGKKGNPGSGTGDIQVNLIVDPGMFGRGADHDGEAQSDPDDDDYDHYTIPGSYSHPSSPHSRPRRKARPRRSIFAGLAQESAWREARKLLKRMAWIDVGGVVVWGALFVFILIGKRCPAGQFNGWCTGYNVSSASACLLCVAFGVNIFFDVKDLYASRVSPRTKP